MSTVNTGPIPDLPEVEQQGSGAGTQPAQEEKTPAPNLVDGTTAVHPDNGKKTPAARPRPSGKPLPQYRAGDCSGFAKDFGGEYTVQKIGHSIISIPVKQTVDPLLKLVVTAYEVLCARCGRSLDEIRKEYQKK